MPHPHTDPWLVAARRHATRIRADLDRLDTAVDSYHGPGRDRLVAVVMNLRVDLDEIEARIDAEAAGL